MGVGFTLTTTTMDLYEVRNHRHVMDEAKEQIRTYFARLFRNANLQDDTDIFATGFVNSLMAMQLVMFVEKEFDITIENEDLDLENFKSIDAIAGLVRRRAGVKGVQASST